jgi:DinB superfamily
MAHGTLAEAAPAARLTFEEREHADRYLAATRDLLVESLKGLSAAQWNFKPAPDRWSIAEVMEHVAIVEDRVQEIIDSMAQGPADAADRDIKQVDAFVLAVIPMRHPKYKAPERVSPLSGRTGSEMLEKFLRSRVHTEELLRCSPDLRGRVLPHPVFGPWDGYQWILAAGSHCARHTGQILEVKADPNFPGN